ncbi:MAG: AAA family ATPase [Prevotella sp.]
MISILIDRADIAKAKEKLGDEMAHIIAEELNIKDFDEKNLKGCCPFHSEDHASFIWNKKALCFRCFGACGRNYDIIDVFMYKGSTYIEAVQKLFELAKIPYAFGEHKLKTKRSYIYPKEVICDNKSKVYAYLEKRKISKQTADYLDIRQDEQGNCVFNYYDVNDVLTMVKYRPSRMIHKGENKNWCQRGADTSPLLFNMNRINPEQPLLICSGELDAAAAIEAGWTNSVSIPLGDQNLDFCRECYDWLEQFHEIIIAHDNDESGMKFYNSVNPMLGSWRCKVVKIPDHLEVDGKTVFVKDVNEYLFYTNKHTVLDAILSAEDSPVPSVVDLSSVEPTEYEDVDGVTFGLKALDEEIMRLFFGTLTIISGQPGAGKSSLLTQLMCNALDQGIKTWLFSGELPNGVEKSWFNYIFAGRRNVEKAVSRRGNEYFKIPTEARVAINKTYKDKWFIYRDDYDNDLDSLIQSMTDVVRKYGVRLLILDNFMTIDAEQDDNELRAQTNTIKKLIAFAKKYNTAVILVCHPRKTEKNNPNIGIYDIAGTSNIINLAHRTISLRRVTDDDRDNSAHLSEKRKLLLKYDVIVTIIKDRMFGRSNIDTGVFYDSESRRFYTTQEEFDKRYSWDTHTYNEPLISERIDDESEVIGNRITNTNGDERN